MEDKRRLTDEEWAEEIKEIKALAAEQKRKEAMRPPDIFDRIEKLESEIPSLGEYQDALAVVSQYLSPIGGLNSKIDFVHDLPATNAPEEVKAAWAVIKKSQGTRREITRLKEKYGIPIDDE